MRFVAALLLCLSLAACFRTHYANFSAQNPDRSPTAMIGDPVRSGREWQHFFIWGWVPAWRKFDARQACGSSENIHSIETRRTFLEGLVAAFAGYYINIYSPWNGAIHCRATPQ